MEVVNSQKKMLLERDGSQKKDDKRWQPSFDWYRNYRATNNVLWFPGHYELITG